MADQPNDLRRVRRVRRNFRRFYPLVLLSPGLYSCHFIPIAIPYMHFSFARSRLAWDPDGTTYLGGFQAMLSSRVNNKR